MQDTTLERAGDIITLLMIFAGKIATPYVIYVWT